MRTRVKSGGAWHGFQEFMILRRAQGPVEDVAFDGIEGARASEPVLDAIGAARAIVIGPSNPVISIRPILEVPGLTNALRDAPAPIVAVSPIVSGEVLKGPTGAFMDWAGLTLDATYTEKALASALVEAARGRQVLYWHTLSSAPLEPLLRVAPAEHELPGELLRLLR